ncbi:MAG: hypothetical protein AAB177_12665, partial [Nitrospirota bacterium]
GYDAARTNAPEKRGCMMHAKQKQHTQRDLQSEGNLAVRYERQQILQKPKNKTFPPVLRPVPAMTEENLNDDTLAPAIGIISAFGLSVILWGLIILGISWIW